MPRVHVRCGRAEMTAGRRVADPLDYVTIGQAVAVWVMSVDLARRRLALTMIEPVVAGGEAAAAGATGSTGSRDKKRPRDNGDGMGRGGRGCGAGSSQDEDGAQSRKAAKHHVPSRNGAPAGGK